MRKKIILFRHYSFEGSFRSDLVYEEELLRHAKFINAIKKSNPGMQDEEAYLAFRNMISSTNVYSIEEVEND